MLEPGSLWPSVRFHCSHWFAPSVSTCGDSWWLVLPGPSPGRGPPPPSLSWRPSSPLLCFLNKELPLGSHLRVPSQRSGQFGEVCGALPS